MHVIRTNLGPPTTTAFCTLIYHHLRATQVEETNDTRSYVLRSPGVGPVLLSLRPVLHVPFQVDDEELIRILMSSAPETDPRLVTKGAPAQGVELFNDHAAEATSEAKPGGVLRARGPSIVAFCGGSGVTP
jgi:hypothetical protein